MKDRNWIRMDGPLPEFTPEELRRAALAVCDGAIDAADARNLLELLGLRDELAAAGLVPATGAAATREAAQQR